MILTNYKTIDTNDKVIQEHIYPLPINKILSAKELGDLGEEMAMHAVMYKAEKLKKISYRQSEGISYTDQEWIFEPMTMVNSFYFVNESLYLYLVGREGQTMDLSRLKKNMNQNIRVLERLVIVYEQIEESQIIFPYLKGRIENYSRFIYTMYLLNSNQLELSELINFDKKLREHSARLYNFVGRLRAGRFPFVKVWRWIYYTKDYGVNRFFAERRYRFLIFKK